MLCDWGSATTWCILLAYCRCKSPASLCAYRSRTVSRTDSRASARRFGRPSPYPYCIPLQSGFPSQRYPLCSLTLDRPGATPGPRQTILCCDQCSVCIWHHGSCTDRNDSGDAHDLLSMRCVCRGGRSARVAAQPLACRRAFISVHTTRRPFCYCCRAILC